MTDTSSRHVTIVGGHGQIARLLTVDLVERGHTVRGLVRHEDQFDDLRSDGAEPVLCDVEHADASELDTALADTDVVVFAAGAGPGSGPERKQTVDRDGAIKAVAAAVRVGAQRFVVISSMGADDPPSGDETFSVYLRAKRAADDAVRSAAEGSELGAVIVRPGALTDDAPTGEVALAETVDRAEIPRADVAAVLAELIDSGLGDGHVVELVSGSTSIVDAVRSLD